MYNYTFLLEISKIQDFNNICCDITRCTRPDIENDAGLFSGMFYTVCSTCHNNTFIDYTCTYSAMLLLSAINIRILEHVCITVLIKRNYILYVQSTIFSKHIKMYLFLKLYLCVHWRIAITAY